MSEKKSEAVEHALKFVLDALESGKDFVLEQAPLVAQEIVAYGRIHNIVYGAICVLVAVALGYCEFRLANFVLSRFDPDFPYSLIGVLPMVAGVVGFVVCVCNAISYFDMALKATYAPRLYLLEELSRLVK